MKSVQSPKTVRCAIYTRKSSEEGLEQSFNSLHAQREACEAYVRSQAHEGWVLLDTPYDDGGFSGGNVERPGLKQLMSDIDAGLIDLVLVYKVDRLSRSLADFVRLIERFDHQDIAFVSVTQQFNTASSMGRLTLNVLLSFAQFEREVTGERIRDKIAASKKKGLWMGGAVPLGYDVIDRQLTINVQEAEQVTQIYQYYLNVKSVRELKQWCESNQILSKQRVTRNGKHIGGNPFTRGALYNLLKNPVYVGKITHKDKRYDGQHEAIIDGSLWQQVQDVLATNRRKTTLRTQAKTPSLLAGLLYDDRNNPMSPSHAKKENRRYCYYVSQAKLQMRPQKAGSLVSISSEKLDPIVIQMITAFLNDTDKVLDALPTDNCSAVERLDMLAKIQGLITTLVQGSLHDKIQLVNTIVDAITVGKNKVDVKLDVPLFYRCATHSNTGDQPLYTKPVILTESVALKRAGTEARLSTHSNKETLSSTESNALGLATLKAFRWHDDLIRGNATSAKDIADKENVCEQFVQARLNLALLPPDLLEALLEGTTDPSMNLERVKKGNVGISW